MEGINKAEAAAQAISQSIAALRKLAAAMSAAGRLEDAVAINHALDGLQKSLKRIRVDDQSGKVKTVH
ncbi:hypothetical protein D3C76_1417170 [compost metagenome]